MEQSYAADAGLMFFPIGLLILIAVVGGLIFLATKLSGRTIGIVLGVFC